MVGRNGVGKTTLLRLMLGELAPAAGASVVRGRPGVLRQAPAAPEGARLADLMGAEEGLAPPPVRALRPTSPTPTGGGEAPTPVCSA